MNEVCLATTNFSVLDVFLKRIVMCLKEVLLVASLLLHSSHSLVLREESSSSVLDSTVFNVSYKYEEAWRSWKATHSKKYLDATEDLLRHQTWLSNMKFIEGHNANAHIFGFTLAMNHLGDMVCQLVQ